MHYSNFPGRINVEKTSEQYFQLLLPIENQKKLFKQERDWSARLYDKQVDDRNGSEETI